MTTDLATLRQALDGYSVRDFVEDHAAMDRVEAGIARLTHALLALGYEIDDPAIDALAASAPQEPQP